MQKICSHRGFTLVELSIVLVIIGLLIGGILVGQSLIDSAKLSNEVRRLTQYSIAFMNFRQKFKQEAGNSNLFTPVGNGDNDTQDTNATCVSENILAWAHLSQSGMIKESYSCASGLNGVAPYSEVTNAVASSYDNRFNSYIFPAHRLYSGDRYAIHYGYNIIKANYAGIGNHRYFITTYPAQNVWALDRKIDDGNTTTGSAAAVTWYDNHNCIEDTIRYDADDSGNPYSDLAYCYMMIGFSPTLEMPLTAN